MASEWIDSKLFESGVMVVFDAMGQQVPDVETARFNEDGEVEAFVILADIEGNELVCSHDEGRSLEPIRARATIPGAMIEEIENG